MTILLIIIAVAVLLTLPAAVFVFALCRMAALSDAAAREQGEREEP